MIPKQKFINDEIESIEREWIFAKDNLRRRGLTMTIEDELGYWKAQHRKLLGRIWEEKNDRL